MNTTVARYLLGLVCLALIFAPLCLAAVALRRRFLVEWSGAVARLAELILAFALLIAVLELLGAVGLFKLAPIVVGSLLVGVGLTWAAGGTPGWPRREARRPRPGVAATAAIATAFTAAVAAEWASPTLQAYDVGIHVLDSIWYHLPLAASFAQSGHVTPLHFDVEFLTAFYPASSEMLHALGIVALGRDTLSPALNLLLLAPTSLAAWCIGRSRGASGAAVAGVMVVLATPMMVYSQGGSADNDLLGVFFFLAAVAFLLHDAERPAALILAAVAAGLAVSVRLTLLAPVAALTVGVIAIAPAGRRRWTAMRWLVPLVLVGGYWFARNLVAVGNPAPWAGLGMLPTPAPPLQGKVGFTIAHYLGDVRVWKHFWQPALASGFGGWWYLIVAGAIAGPLLCLISGPGRRVRMLAVVALVSFGAYLLTPESAMGPPGDPVGISYNLRYAAPPLTLGLALLPLAGCFAGARRQLALTLAFAVILIATVAEPRLWPDRHLAGAVPVGIAFLICGGVVLVRHRIPRVALASVACALLAAGAAGGYAWQRHYLRGRYAFKPGVSHLAKLWAFFRPIHHQRVGLVGTYGAFFSYPLFGIDGSNSVAYVARRGPHGSFIPITSCRQWRRAVNAGHFRYLVATPGRDPFRTHVLSFSPEADWTRGDPAARVVFSDRAASARVLVFELRGPLDPGGCA